MNNLTTTKTFTLPSIPPMRGTEFEGTGFYLWDNFKTHFVGNKEPKQSKQSYKLSTLQQPALDKDILTELGNAEVTLGQLYTFLKTADKSGWYVAYVKDAKGTLWPVNCDWYSGVQEWNVYANSITDTRPWGAGHQFFSREISTSKEIELTGGKKASVSSEDFEYLSSHKWYLDSKGYATRNVQVDGKRTKELMHRVVLQRKLGELSSSDFVDHADRNPLNNTRENLRVATRSQNQANCISIPNKTGFRGVQRSKSGKRWKSVIKYEQKTIHLGYFPTPEEAAIAYNHKAIELFGEFALLNNSEPSAPVSSDSDDTLTLGAFDPTNMVISYGGTKYRLEDIIRYYIQENHGTEDSERFVQRALETVDGKIMNTVFDEQERIKDGFRLLI